MHKVYLAGPITGISYDVSEDWRDKFKSTMKDFPHIHLYSPLRGKEYLREHGVLEDEYPRTLLSTEKAIMARDFFDVSTSNALVANLTGAGRVSIGTVMEVAWAYQRKIPVIIIGGHFMHDHAMMRQAADWWVDDMDDAATVLKTLFTS